MTENEQRRVPPSALWPAESQCSPVCSTGGAGLSARPTMRRLYSNRGPARLWRGNPPRGVGAGWQTERMTSLTSYFATRTFEITWPHALVVAELDRLLALADARQPVTGVARSDRWNDQVERFMREVFTSPNALSEWQLAQRQPRHALDDPWASADWQTETQTSPNAWLRELRAHANVLPTPRARAPYWSERQGQGTRPRKLDLTGVARRFSDYVASLEVTGYLAWAFGQECVDGDWTGDLGDEPTEEINRLLGRDGIWPVQAYYAGYSLDDLCDVIEFLADHVRRPMWADMHSFSGCGWHYGGFDPDRGLQVYRWRINELLGQSDLELTLAENGRLERTAPNAVEDLVSTVRETKHVHRSDDQELAHALDQFRRRGATVLDRRQAVITLAGILERRRAQLKQDLLRKDEGVLFQLANEFGIRHQKADQRTDYDPKRYLEWIFYWYLATINLTNQIVADQTVSVHIADDSNEPPF